MGEKLREARVTLGSKTYLLSTALDRKQLDTIIAFSQRLFGSFDQRIDQEKRLVLGWMYMAYKLYTTEEKLKAALDKIEASDMTKEASNGEINE